MSWEPQGRGKRDPWAVGVANASLVGAGYLMLGRRGWAVLSWAVTVALLIVLGTAQRTVRCEWAFAVWWAVMVVHGWHLAGGRWKWPSGVNWREPYARFAAGWRLDRVRTQRWVALGVAVPVLAAVVLLRVDAAHAEGTVAAARRSGDCTKAVHAQHSVWFGPRLADSPGTRRGERTAAACRRLAVAAADLRDGLGGDTEALAAGFDAMSAVLADGPGNEAIVSTVLDGFLDGIPTANPCRTAAVTDWLRARKADGSTLDRASAVVPRTAPAALLGCANNLMAGKSWTKAKARYQQVLDQFPHDAKAAAAKSGAHRAELAIELDNVTRLLDTYGDTQPTYCTAPARYSGAPARHKGVNKALFFGNSTYTDKLPAGWSATDASDATLVVCASDDKDGPSVQTCPYKGGLYTTFPEEVTFHKIAIPVKVYELRTGRLVSHRTLEVDGKSCPSTLEYTTWENIDTGPSSDQYVIPTTSDIRAAFHPLVTR
ncbi:hypothetical protein [Streptomyces sp. CA2R106]|uniref:hypothetical protein n=1 Tax=Streptomyces sp. CA2R106 TaxID=3120153 RepID=UPI0030092395